MTKEQKGYFLRNFFAAFTFVFFAAGVTTQSPYAFMGALLCGAMSRSAARKGWDDPPWADAVRRSFSRIKGRDVAAKEE